MDEINTTRIKEKFYTKLREERSMKKNRKPAIMTAVAAALVLTVSISVFGQDIINAVREIVVGENENIHYFMMEEVTTLPIPQELAGQAFDAEGNMLTEYTAETKFYNAAGEEVFMYWLTDGTFTLGNREEYDAWGASIYKQFDDLDEALGYFDGEARVPASLPQGIVFGTAIFSDYKQKLFTEGNDSIQIIYSDTEKQAGFTLSIKNMGDTGGVGFYTPDDSRFDSEPEELLINGNKATIMGDTLHVEIDNIMYSFNPYGNTSIDELVKIAESL